MNNQLQMLIRAESRPEPAHWQTFDGEQRLEVREMSIHERLQILARDVSPYRHALLLDGLSYAILNVVRPH
jgi:hypothetical protein